MFNAHVLSFFHAKWRHHANLALRTRGAERQLHNRNSIHWGQLYVDEYPNFSYPDVTAEGANAIGTGLPQDDHGQRPRTEGGPVHGDHAFVAGGAA